jgi:hypothetical protein
VRRHRVGACRLCREWPLPRSHGLPDLLEARLGIGRGDLGDLSEHNRVPHMELVNDTLAGRAFQRGYEREPSKPELADHSRPLVPLS